MNVQNDVSNVINEFLVNGHEELNYLAVTLGHSRNNNICMVLTNMIILANEFFAIKQDRAQ